jgi:hypothetical protein
MNNSNIDSVVAPVQRLRLQPTTLLTCNPPLDSCGSRSLPCCRFRLVLRPRENQRNGPDLGVEERFLKMERCFVHAPHWLKSLSLRTPQFLKSKKSCTEQPDIFAILLISIMPRYRSPFTLDNFRTAGSNLGLVLARSGFNAQLSLFKLSQT